MVSRIPHPLLGGPDGEDRVPRPYAGSPRIVKPGSLLHAGDSCMSTPGSHLRAAGQGGGCPQPQLRCGASGSESRVRGRVPAAPCRGWAVCTVPRAGLHPTAPVCASLKEAAGSRVLQEALAASQWPSTGLGSVGRAGTLAMIALVVKPAVDWSRWGEDNSFIFRAQGLNPGLQASAVTSACSFSFCESCWEFSLWFVLSRPWIKLGGVFPGTPRPLFHR